MPKSDPAHKGKVELPEEDMLSSEDDTGPPLHVLPQRPRKKMKVGTSEQERVRKHLKKINVQFMKSTCDT